MNVRKPLEGDFVPIHKCAICGLEAQLYTEEDSDGVDEGHRTISIIWYTVQCNGYGQCKSVTIRCFTKEHAIEEWNKLQGVRNTIVHGDFVNHTSSALANLRR